MNDKIFCNKPFGSIFLGPDGGIRPCCSLTGGDLGNLNIQPIEEILNGGLAKSIRQSFINNEWHPSCSLCKNLEDIGPGLSEKIFIESEYENITKVGADYFKLRSMDLRWTNLCNLACNYCMPYFSSRWAQINNTKVNSLHKDNVSTLLQYVKNNLDGIYNIMMLGGEPLLQKENNELLDILATAKNNIDITMLTNLSNPIETNNIAQKLLSRTNGRVDWCISIETVGDRFEYVRDGASWEVLNNNIAILNKNRPTVSCINLYPIYCLYSAFNLEEYFKWAVAINADSIRWQMLNDPAELSILNLNNDLKSKAIAEIDNIVEKYSTRFDMQSLLHIKKEISSFKELKQISIHRWTINLEKNKLTNKKFTFSELWPDLSTKLS